MKALIKSDLVYIGALGQSMPMFLQAINKPVFYGKTVTLIGNTLPWHMRIDDKYLRIGQHKSTWYGTEDLYAPKERPTIDEINRNLIYDQQKAIFGLDDRIKLELVESDARKLIRSGGQKILYCENGEMVSGSKFILGTGIGPEKDASQSGVIIRNQASGNRLICHEITTGLQSLSMTKDFFKGKRIVVMGGGALAAWVMEQADYCGASEALWVARDFDGANPGGRNSYILEKTVGIRKLGKVATATYLGHPAEVGGLSCGVEFLDGNITNYQADILVVATGSNPYGTGGIGSILGEEYSQLKPVPMSNGGIVGVNKYGDVMVTTSALYNTPNFTPSIVAHTFPIVNDDAKITASNAVSRASIVGTVELLTSLEAASE